LAAAADRRRRCTVRPGPGAQAGGPALWAAATGPGPPVNAVTARCVSSKSRSAQKKKDYPAWPHPMGNLAGP
jgi:hypothetical protein